VTLLWISTGISAFETILGLVLDPPPRDFLGSFLVMLAAGYLIYACLIVYASRRKNWARIALLVLTVATVVLLFIPSLQVPEDTLWSWASTIGILVLDALALYWLFVGVGGKWYSPRAIA
jgi:hypothetical protein